MERSRTMSEHENGGIKLPIGFRFHPTDEELVVHYLKRKVFSLSLPANVIPEFDVFHSNPWDLPGDSKEKRYFFSKKEWNVVKKCNNSLRAGCGYWKAIGKDKQIVAPGTNLVIGIKKSSVFYKGKNSGRLKTQWVMHEFSLVGSVITPYLTQKLMIQMGDWVVCRLYQRKRKGRNNISNVNAPLGNIKNSRNFKGTKPSDHLDSRIGLEDGSEFGFSFLATSSSSCPSGITEISSNDLDQEASSHNISFGRGI